MRSSNRTRLLAALTVVAALGLAACGSDDDTSSSTDAPAATDAATPSESSADPAAPADTATPADSAPADTTAAPDAAVEAPETVAYVVQNTSVPSSPTPHAFVCEAATTVSSAPSRRTFATLPALLAP